MRWPKDQIIGRALAVAKGMGVPSGALREFTDLVYEAVDPLTIINHFFEVKEVQ